jgi:hypothetical protein
MLGLALRGFFSGGTLSVVCCYSLSGGHSSLVCYESPGLCVDTE